MFVQFFVGKKSGRRAARGFQVAVRGRGSGSGSEAAALASNSAYTFVKRELGVICE